jgi:hypothetical protein
MMDDDDLAETFETLTEVKTFQPTTLYVNVDFNDLIDSLGMEIAFETVGKLKDLLA